MAVLVGIDEAGFGPILGPLVVSSSAFSVPEHLAKADIWQVLRRSIGYSRRHLAGRLLITDSKKAYSKKIGTRHLKHTVLACLKYLDENPVTLSELLSFLCPDLLERLQDYPWYKGSGDYEISVDEPSVLIASEVLRDDTASNNIKLLELKSCCLDVWRYNRMVSVVKNKSTVLFTATCRLIKHAFDNFAADGLHIIVDRMSGRVHYRRILQRMFPDMQLKIMCERQTKSSYELKTDGKSMHLHFIVKADEKILPTSLASMVSKFLRELLMENINRYFAHHCADIRPTAGYWKDGLRFIEDLQNNGADSHINMEQLVRCK
ncbi:hypothetical protein ACFL1G_02615 [Planctomycetota bacterium]